MPAEEGFVVRFLGDNTPLEKASDDAAASLLKVDKAATEAGTSIGNTAKISSSAATQVSKVAVVSKQASQAAAQMAKSADVAGGSLARVDKSAGASTQTLINLSRVAQDAPYGFIGIANNLNPLLESFQRLRSETGSNKTALQALASSLAGPAGIGLALGVVSSLIVAFGDNIFGSSNEVNKFDAELETLNSTLKDTADRIDSIKGNLDFSNQLGSINNELAGLGKSVDLEAKVIATRDAILKLEPEVDALSRQKVDLAVDLEASGGKGLSDKEIDSLKQKLESVTQAFDKSYKDLQELRQTAQIAETSARLALKKEGEERVKDAEEAAKKLAAASKKAHDESLRRLKEQAEERFRLVQSLRSGAIDFTPPDEFFKREAAQIAEPGGNEDFKKIARNNLANLTIKPRLNIVPESVTVDINKITKEIDALGLGAIIRNIIINGIENGIGNLGESIGAAIAAGEDPIKAAGQSILGSVGDLISQIGKALIKYGVTKAGLDKILQGGIAIPGVAAIALGLTAVAIGSLIKNSFKPKAFAQGGLAFGPTLGFVGEGIGTSRSNPEIIAPLDKLKNFIGERNDGGNVFIPDLKIGYDSLRVAFTRANKRGGLFS